MPESIGPQEFLEAMETFVAAARENERRLQAAAKSSEQAYHERNQLILLLAKVFPAYLTNHPITDTTWQRDWLNIVAITIPVAVDKGEKPRVVQAMWHLHDSEVAAFAFLPRVENNWDGHTTEEKYERLAGLSADALRAATLPCSKPQPPEKRAAKGKRKK